MVKTESRIRRLARKMFRSQAGFTLIELLVVVGIIGALAGVAIPAVAKFVNSGKNQANAAELQNVQTSMDVYMADNGVTSVAANGTATDDFSTSTPVLYPTYLRTNPSRCSYTWDATGKILVQSACP